jgi:hypothetical protein
MGGVYGLMGVKEGDILDVLEEGVGPDKFYNLCRQNDENGKPVAIGWYPSVYTSKEQSTGRFWFWNKTK